jgi:hypothetical protein
MRSMRFCLLILAFALPLSATAQGFGAVRWDYVAASVVAPELDEFGYELEGSTAVTDNLVVFGSWMDFEPNEDIDRNLLAIGVGRRWNIRPNIDVMVSASYGDNEIVERGFEFEEEGIIVGLDVRGWATPRIELNGAILLDNSTGSSTEVVMEVGAEFSGRRNVSYGGLILNDESDTTAIVGLHFYFGASSR